VDHSLLFPAVIAPSDFDPTAARPAYTASAAAEPVPPAGQTNALRPSAKAWAVDRPRRRSLLELGLAVGPDAGAWEAGMLLADAEARREDRARAAAKPKAGAMNPAADPAAADPAPAAAGMPPAVLGMASEVQTLNRQRRALTQELAELERRQDELQGRIMQLLRQAGLAPPPATPEPERPPPGSGLPNATWD